MQSEKPLQYVEMEPSPAVRDVVMSYWGFAVHALPTPDFVHRVWPDGCVLLAMGFTDGVNHIAAVAGASTVATAVPVRAGEQYWGIRFRPESGAVSCGRDALQLKDQRLWAHDVFGDTMIPLLRALETVHDADQAARVMDAWMLQHRVAADVIDTLVRDAVRRIVQRDGTGTVREVADALHITTRQLQRRFRAATGMSPKEYANIRRAHAALRRVAMGGNTRTLGGWARLAAEAGYADQAHLSRECARLMMLTPSTLSNRLSDIAHDHLVD
ncbi:MAG: helix-turn-helix transcriptional regulator [Phycisphaerae bacterium]|nr:helix-turn-helix transcriptional regulator [Gemmatimonadaceae bacterium]